MICAGTSMEKACWIKAGPETGSYRLISNRRFGEPFAAACLIAGISRVIRRGVESHRDESRAPVITWFQPGAGDSCHINDLSVGRCDGQKFLVNSVRIGLTAADLLVF